MGPGETTVVHPATANTAMIFMCWVKSSPNSSTSPFCMETHNKSRWKYVLQFFIGFHQFSSIKGLLVWIKNTSKPRLSPIKTSTILPPQVAAGADPDPTTTFPNLGGWLHGEILISFAQKLNETLHSNQSGNHLQTFTSRISFWCASCLII